MENPGPLWTNGPQPGSFYSTPGNLNSKHNAKDDTRRTLQPIVTGTSVLGLKYDGGVILAADTLGSYGSMARFRNVSRLMKVNDSTILGASGDYADYQSINSTIEQLVIDDEVLDDGYTLKPRSVFSWMTRVMYNRRSKYNPYWNTVIIGGHDNGHCFLGYVDKIGTAFEAPSVASGYGAYIAQPLLRKVIEEHGNGLSQQTALQSIEECLKVLYYRDARSYNRFEIAIVDEKGVKIIKNKTSAANWEVAHYVKGFE